MWRLFWLEARCRGLPAANPYGQLVPLVSGFAKISTHVGVFCLAQRWEWGVGSGEWGVLTCVDFFEGKTPIGNRSRGL